MYDTTTAPLYKNSTHNMIIKDIRAIEYDREKKFFHQMNYLLLHNKRNPSFNISKYILIGILPYWVIRVDNRKTIVSKLKFKITLYF